MTCAIKFPIVTADCFHVHAVLEGQGRECVSQVVEADVLQLSVLQYFLMEFYNGVWVVHLSGHWRGEHVLVVRVLAVLLNQQVNCILRDGYLTEMVLWSMSKSDQRSATNSPLRSPLTSSR